MKKFISLFTLGLTALVLTACGGQGATKPEDVVSEFLTAIKAGDFEKAGTYVHSENVSDEFDFNSIYEEESDETVKALLKGISNKYDFKSPEENMIDDNKAEVNVEITSIDFAAAMGTAMEEIFNAAFELAMNEGSEEEYNKQMEAKSVEILTNTLTAEDVETVTREVKLNVEKDKEGNFKILSDANLMEAVLGNSEEVEEMFEGF
ncbi:hypothetical protein CD30_12340 [Ureibacillus massiliensis 4400831 = CIP 108448 = CCUG 49529]|uniref:Uncharacterized protein n=1 Tax=Ureibacillus massiliensis 4400831 = CIP 108448 = CCUG 49529 TaxID=1211035 RepID=A0A0A3J017_9BACL|nr:DUF4878 domain-containing protein [Ureibacillus massiliensis]KGR90349.1 hypothetical protein CD30_12340 [Ureibacillus massiliensis 4400831 = CIP 108448 = CCUG 49529]